LKNQTFRVFLCSTYSDLIDEREAVLRVIQRLQLLHVSMEFFGARPETPLETVLEEVRASDIVVVIIGHRYGTLVPNKRVSYTEIEYKEAWKNNKPCLVYVRSDDVPILPSYIEKDPFRIKALEKFKKLLQSRHLMASYMQAQDLAVHVAVDIERIIKVKKQEPPLESTDSTLSLLDSLNTPSFLCDSDNRILNVNQTLTKVLGYSASDIVGKALAEFIDNTNDDWWLNNSISYFTDKGSRYTEQIFKKKDGHSIYLELDILKYELGGNEIFQCVARDITERKRAEEELRLSEAKSREYSEQLEKMVEERTRALREYQEERRKTSDVLGQAEKAYNAYMEAERQVARMYKENEYQLDEAYKAAERRINKAFDQSMAQALITRDEALQKDPLSYQQAIDIYDEAIKQALTTFKDAMEKAWKVRSDTIEQAWNIYSKIIR